MSNSADKENKKVNAGEAKKDDEVKEGTNASIRNENADADKHQNKHKEDKNDETIDKS